MAEDRHVRIMIAGGGTGGHLFPALAIAEEIAKIQPAAEFLFVGTRKKIEARVVPQRGFAFKTVWISGFHRRWTRENLLFPLKVMVSFVQSFVLIKMFKPDVVLGTGGYVCGPVLVAASTMGIPTVVHESNSYPGVTTKSIGARASKVFISFEETRRWLSRKDNVELVGTPTRESLTGVSREEGAEFFGLKAEAKTILVVGGSLGAASINTAVLRAAESLVARGVQIIWQAGAADYERVLLLAGKRTGVWLGPFIERMECAYAAADLVVCRAGATTLAELTRLGKPAILIPYPSAAEDHQTRNAKSLVEAGAADLIRDADAESQLMTAVLLLLDDAPKRAVMSRASAALGRPNAGSVIAAKILRMVS